MTELEVVKKQLAEARLEIEDLKLRLMNVTHLYRTEMTVAGKRVKPDKKSVDPI